MLIIPPGDTVLILDDAHPPPTLEDTLDALERSMDQNDVILLRPRPYAKLAGAFVLLPLLPHPKPLKPLPSEIWTEIFAFAFCDEDEETTLWSWSFLTVCKSFSEIALPLLYASVRITQISGLIKFHKRLHTAHQKWDSIRRIPYSSPGRWVQRLNVSEVAFEGQAGALHLDTLLTEIFPLTPFLASLSVNPAFVLSRRALSSLAERDGAVNLRSISGLSYTLPPSQLPDSDPFVKLLRQCPGLEVLVVVGQGLDPTELEFHFSSDDFPPMESFIPLHLPKLRILSLLSMHSSPLMLALLHSPLPSLKKLSVTPYHDIPYPASLVTSLITNHGPNLASLLLFTPKSWPTRLHPSPENILTLAPNLNHLSLEAPLPHLALTEPHTNLRILSIPRPRADFWMTLARLLPLLPNLSVLRARDVRWLKRGLSNMAREAGVQGEMHEWKHRLKRRSIRVLDADWREYENE